MQAFESTQFIKKRKKLPTKVFNAMKERFLLFTKDPQNPVLNNHRLHGKRKHQRSINITGDWRLVFEQVDGNTVRLLDIDTHANLYGS
ncbi:MAG: hypothetical protein RLZZ416_91 [Candidatus Parcubacteria bacterium]|jgi:addiction module RelE/StbE family toxin